MSSFSAIVHILKALVDMFQYLTGAISLEIYNGRIQKIQTAVRKATSKDLNEALDGTDDLENSFNRHSH